VKFLGLGTSLELFLKTQGLDCELLDHGLITQKSRDLCWGCGAKPTRESPTELCLTRQTFANDIAVHIFIHFVGRDNPNGRRGFHLVRDSAGHDGGRRLPELPKDEANMQRDMC
jgi:hypothetical protein